MVITVVIRFVKKPCTKVNGIQKVTYLGLAGFLSNLVVIHQTYSKRLQYPCKRIIVAI